MEKLLDLVEQVRFAELKKIVKMSQAQEQSSKEENEFNIYSEK